MPLGEDPLGRLDRLGEDRRDDGAWGGVRTERGEEALALAGPEELWREGTRGERER